MSSHDGSTRLWRCRNTSGSHRELGGEGSAAPLSQPRLEIITSCPRPLGTYGNAAKAADNWSAACGVGGEFAGEMSRERPRDAINVHKFQRLVAAEVSRRLDPGATSGNA